MLLALRSIVDADLPLPVRVGVNRGPVFTGEVGPPYRRWYAVMGDTVNLAARLMGKAPPGHVYATREVLRGAKTSFEQAALEPFTVKGKGNWSRRGMSVRRSAVRPGSDPARAAAGRPRGLRARPLCGSRWTRRRRRGDADRARGGDGQRQVAAARRGCGARRGHGRRCARRARLHAPHALLGVAGAPASAARRRMRTTPEPRCSIGSSTRSDDNCPTCSRGSRCSRSSSTSRPAVEPRSSSWRRRRAPPSSTRSCSASSAAPWSSRRSLRSSTPQLMDAASVALFEALARELEPRRLGRRWSRGATRPAACRERLRARNASAHRALAAWTLTELAQATQEAAQLPPHVLELAADRSGAAPSSCSTCSPPPPRATATSFPTASAPPRWRASTPWTRATARSSAGPRCSG